MKTHKSSSHWRGGMLALCAAALMALPLTAVAGSYENPVIPPPATDPDPPSQGGGDGDNGGNEGGDNNGDGGDSSGNGGGSNPPPPPSGSDPKLDSAGQSNTVTLDDKARGFESRGARSPNGLQYGPSTDSSGGGGTDGGFPMWEGNGDWKVEKPANCKVAGKGEMVKIPGTKRQTFSCYLDWMDGNKKYVGLKHCNAAANNTKADVGGETKSYHPGVCPHPRWVTGSWQPKKSSCGKYTQKRSASCKIGSKTVSNSQCSKYNGSVREKRSAGKACPPPPKPNPGYFVIEYHYDVRSTSLDTRENIVTFVTAPKCIAFCKGVDISKARMGDPRDPFANMDPTWKYKRDFLKPGIPGFNYYPSELLVEKGFFFKWTGPRSHTAKFHYRIPNKYK